MKEKTPRGFFFPESKHDKIRIERTKTFVVGTDNSEKITTIIKMQIVTRKVFKVVENVKEERR